MKTRFDVPDASCEQCRQKLTSALSPQDGVARVEVDLEAGTVIVDHDQRATPERLAEVIAQQGYQVEREPIRG